MLSEICANIKNYFTYEQDKHFGDFAIVDGVITPSFDIPTDYIRIVGSHKNDGVHKRGQNGKFGLTDEADFHGAVWVMSPPADFLALVAEMDEVLHVWLINPPPYTAWFCICILLAYCIDKLALGHHVAISAKGKIGLYHSVVGTTFFLSIPIAIGLVCAGFGPLSIGMMYVIVYSLISIERIILAHYLVEMSVRYYILRIILPISIFACVSYSCAHIVTLLFPPSFLRIVATAFVAFLVMCIGFWFIILDDDERLYIRAAIKRAKVRFRTKTKDYV